MLIGHVPNGDVGVLLQWVTSAEESWAMVRTRGGVIEEWSIKDCRIMREGEEGKDDVVEEPLDDVWWEIIAAEKAWPGWPKDVIHGAAIVAEEAGELVQAALQYTYEVSEDVGKKNMRKEALHTAATAVRFLKNLDMMEERGCMTEGKEGEGNDQGTD